MPIGSVIVTFCDSNFLTAEHFSKGKNEEAIVELPWQNESVLWTWRWKSCWKKRSNLMYVFNNQVMEPQRGITSSFFILILKKKQ